MVCIVTLGISKWSKMSIAIRMCVKNQNMSYLFFVNNYVLSDFHNFI